MALVFRLMDLVDRLPTTLWALVVLSIGLAPIAAAAALIFAVEGALQ